MNLILIKQILKSNHLIFINQVKKLSIIIIKCNHKIYLQLNNSSVDLRVYAMQCLVETARHYYDFLADDILKIFSIMKEYVNKTFN